MELVSPELKAAAAVLAGRPSPEQLAKEERVRMLHMMRNHTCPVCLRVMSVLLCPPAGKNLELELKEIFKHGCA